LEGGQKLNDNVRVLGERSFRQRKGLADMFLGKFQMVLEPDRA